MLIGERPGLSVAESLGVYLTFGPKRGRGDHERNCISNIHGKGGLSYAQAADKLVWLAHRRPAPWPHRRAAEGRMGPETLAETEAAQPHE